MHARLRSRQGLGFILAAILVPACSDGDRSPKPPPAAPTGLTALPRPLARIDLSWTDPDALEAAFLVERSTDGVTFTQVAQVPQNATSYSDLNLQADTQYYYRVRGLGITWGPYSSIATVTTSELWVLPAVTGGPGPRTGAAAIYDPARQRMVLVGGLDGSTFHNDAWELTLPAPPATPVWTELLPDNSPGAPMLRWGHAAIYDPVGDRLLLFGGQVDDGMGGVVFASDVHALSLGASPAWSTPTISNASVLGTEGHLLPVVLYDPARHEMIVTGGEGSPTGLRGDAFILDLATMAWSAIFPSTPPLARSQAAAVFDPVRDRAVVFGGYDSDFADLNGANGETNLLVTAPIAAWTGLSPTTSPPRASGMQGVLDAPNRRMVFWSGDDTDGAPPFHTGLWALDLDAPIAWTLLLATSPMIGTARHCAIYDAANQRLLIFGGDDGSFSPVDTLAWIGL